MCRFIDEINVYKKNINEKKVAFLVFTIFSSNILLKKKHLIYSLTRH